MWKVFDVRGRGGRAEFLQVAIALIAVTAVQVALNLVLDSAASDLTALGFGLAMILLYAVASIRRLHDLGRSGWMMLLWLVPLAGAALFAVCAGADGQPRANRFGAAPKGA